MHIAITGKLGSGKSSVTSILANQLGYEIYSTGNIQRHIASEMGITTLELNLRMKNDSSLDHVIDDAVAKISLERDRIIFDSRMAWHFAHNAFRVFLDVDPYESAKRVFAADRGEVEKYASISEAERALIERGEVERSRFLEIYGVDYYDVGNYDLVIDSTHISSFDVADEIVSKFKVLCEKNGETI